MTSIHHLFDTEPIVSEIYQYLLADDCNGFIEAMCGVKYEHLWKMYLAKDDIKDYKKIKNVYITDYKDICKFPNVIHMTINLTYDDNDIGKKRSKQRTSISVDLPKSLLSLAIYRSNISAKQYLTCNFPKSLAMYESSILDEPFIGKLLECPLYTYTNTYNFTLKSNELLNTEIKRLAINNINPIKFPLLESYENTSYTSLPPKNPELKTANVIIRDHSLSHMIDSKQKKGKNPEAAIPKTPFNEGLESLTMIYRGTINPNILPESLRHLTLREKKISLDRVPSYLESLDIFECKKLPILSDTLHTVHVHSPVDVTTVSWPLLHTLTLSCSVQIIPGSLPLTLKKLFLVEYPFVISNDMLPEYLEELKLPNEFKQNITPTTFNKHLKTLRFNNKYSTRIPPKTLPELTCIIFGENYTARFDENVIPDTVRILVLGNSYIAKINVSHLPKHLTTFVVGNKYNNVIDFEYFESLEILTLGSEYDCMIKHLPKTLKQLTIHNNHYVYLQNKLQNVICIYFTNPQNNKGKIIHRNSSMNHILIRKKNSIMRNNFDDTHVIIEKPYYDYTSDIRMLKIKN